MNPVSEQKKYRGNKLHKYEKIERNTGNKTTNIFEERAQQERTVEAKSEKMENEMEVKVAGLLVLPLWGLGVTSFSIFHPADHNSLLRKLTSPPRLAPWWLLQGFLERSPVPLLRVGTFSLLFRCLLLFAENE